MILRVHGGAITDQMLTGSLRFFKLSSAATGYFANTISTFGGVVIPGAAAGGRSSNETALFQTINGQDETDYNASFAAGTGYTALDLLAMNDGSLVRVDVAGGGTISEFTIVRAGSRGFVTTTVRTTTTGNGDFTMTPASSEESPFVADVYVPLGQGVPNSAADRIFRELTGKATVVIINQIDDNNIHFACDDSGFGWDTNNDDNAVAEMLVAIKALGVAGLIGGGAVLSDNPPVPDNTQSGTTIDLDVGDVTLTETTPFELT